jgi:large subunit ribosomal protein L18
MTVKSKPSPRLRRRRRVRAKISGTAARPRLSVFRSNRGIQAQLIDDVEGRTLAAVNWVEGDLKSLARMDQAKRAGELLAERAKTAGIEECVFDRGGYRYHGKVKALADGAREGGLRF